MLVRILALLLVAAAPPLAAQHSASPADTARVYDVADVQIPPAVLNAADLLDALNAAYPPHLRASGTPGTVQVQLVIGVDGMPRDVAVISATDTSFSAPTVAALGLLRFSPAHLGDKPVAVRAVFPVNWSVAPDSPPSAAATPPADRAPVAESSPCCATPAGSRRGCASCIPAELRDRAKSGCGFRSRKREPSVALPWFAPPLRPSRSRPSR
jgi:hypothetical protein